MSKLSEIEEAVNRIKEVITAEDKTGEKNPEAFGAALARFTEIWKLHLEDIESLGRVFFVADAKRGETKPKHSYFKLYTMVLEEGGRFNAILLLGKENYSSITSKRLDGFAALIRGIGKLEQRLTPTRKEMKPEKSKSS